MKREKNGGADQSHDTQVIKEDVSWKRNQPDHCHFKIGDQSIYNQEATKTECQQ